MKYLYILLAGLFLMSACHSKKTAENTTSTKPTVQKKDTNAAKQLVGVEEFLQKFEKATLLHNKTLLLELMDRDYKVEQHDKALKGNTEQFLNAFYCGYRTDGQGYKCQKYTEITGMNRVELLPNDGNYTATYHVSVKDITVNISWLIMVKKQGKTVTYGFWGAQG